MRTYWGYKMININSDWNTNQLNAFFFSYLIGLLGFNKDTDSVRMLFKLGGLPFEPSNSQIFNWRKTKRTSSIFKHEYMYHFLLGLYKYKHINEHLIFTPDLTVNHLSFFYFKTLLFIFDIHRDSEFIKKCFSCDNELIPTDKELECWLRHDDPETFNLMKFECFVNGFNSYLNGR